MEVEVGGMTDLQYKGYLRLIIALLEKAKQADTLEKMQDEIEALRSLLNSSLAG